MYISKLVTIIKTAVHSPFNVKDITMGFSTDKKNAARYVELLRAYEIIESSNYANNKIIQLTSKAIEIFDTQNESSINSKLKIWIKAIEKNRDEANDYLTVIKYNKCKNYNMFVFDSQFCNGIIPIIENYKYCSTCRNRLKEDIENVKYEKNKISSK